MIDHGSILVTRGRQSQVVEAGRGFLPTYHCVSILGLNFQLPAFISGLSNVVTLDATRGYNPNFSRIDGK